jgi:malate dehydrogenase
MRSAPDLPKKNFTAMLRLDHNRAVSQLAPHRQGRHRDREDGRLGQPLAHHVPGLSASAPSPARPRQAVNDEAWYRNEYIPKVGKRGAAIIEARGASSAASAANAAIDHMRDWALGTNGKWVTMGIPSDGSYGIPQDIVYGVPVTCAGGEYARVTGLAIDDYSRTMMDKTLAELKEEQAGVAGMLG